MKVVIYGATPDSSRYAYKACQSLLAHGHTPILIGRKTGNISGTEITPHFVPEPAGSSQIDTVTLYLSAANQLDIEREILEIVKPRRVIFNPGAENPEFANRLKNAGIISEEACTLVMLSLGNF
jgi:uncharacterized protein